MCKYVQNKYRDNIQCDKCTEMFWTCTVTSYKLVGLWSKIGKFSGKTMT